MNEDLNICVISNDKFTICFKVSRQMFYHLNNLLSKYCDEIDLSLDILDDLRFKVLSMEADYE